MVLHGVTWYYMVLHGITWYYMVLHGITWYYMVLLTPSQSTLDYYSTSLSSLSNATAESPLSFQHLGVHWGRSAQRLWLHHRSRPPALGWFCSHAAQANATVNLQGFSSYICYICYIQTASGDLVPVHQASCLHPPVPAHHGWWCPSRLCQRPCANWWCSVWARCFQMGLSINGWVPTFSGWFFSWKIHL